MTGLIIKLTNYGEGGKIITALTSMGKIQATAPGSRSLKSKLFAGTQPFTYSEMAIEKGKGDLPYLKSCDVIENFYDLRLDVKKLALAVYFADIINLTAMGDDLSCVLRFILNTLYILQKKESFEYMKPAFELRLMALLGFSPCVDRCVSCGKTDNLSFFSVREGGVLCDECKAGISIEPATLAAVRYILSCDEKQVFSFEVSPVILSSLSRICEEAILAQLEFYPKSLSYYNNL